MCPNLFIINRVSPVAITTGYRQGKEIEELKEDIKNTRKAVEMFIKIQHPRQPTRLEGPLMAVSLQDEEGERVLAGTTGIVRRLPSVEEEEALMKKENPIFVRQQ